MSIDQPFGSVLLTVVDSLGGGDTALADGVFTDGVEVDHEGDFQDVGYIGRVSLYKKKRDNFTLKRIYRPPGQ